MSNQGAQLQFGLTDAVNTDDLSDSVDWGYSNRPATFSKMYCGIKPVMAFVEGTTGLFWPAKASFWGCKTEEFHGCTVVTALAAG